MKNNKLFLDDIRIPKDAIRLIPSEFNNKFKSQYEKHGMVFSGTSPDGNLVEAIEIADHPWFLAVQSHPEFKSKPTSAHPLFQGFVKACGVYQENKVAGKK